jgi:hypothetical protein
MQQSREAIAKRGRSVATGLDAAKHSRTTIGMTT